MLGRNVRDELPVLSMDGRLHYVHSAVAFDELGDREYNAVFLVSNKVGVETDAERKARCSMGELAITVHQYRCAYIGKPEQGAGIDDPVRIQNPLMNRHFCLDPIR